MLARIVQWFRVLWLRVTNPLLLWAVSICERRGILPTHPTTPLQPEEPLGRFDRQVVARLMRDEDGFLSRMAEKLIDPRKLKAEFLNRENDPTGELRAQAHARKYSAFQVARDSGTFLDPDHPFITEEDMQQMREHLRKHNF